MKTLNNFIIEGKLVNKLSSDDKHNFELIADEISAITSQISDWMEEDEDNETSDTGALAHSLSQLASQLRGEIKEEVTFDYGK